MREKRSARRAFVAFERASETIWEARTRLIGVAFGLRGTLVNDSDVERRAFCTVAREHATRLNLTLDESRLRSATNELFGSLAFRRAGLPETVACTLDEILGGDRKKTDLEADFRRAAGAAVADVVAPLYEVCEMLGRVASLGIPRAILTNDIASVATREAACMGFDGPVLVAENIDAWKPDRDAFDAVAATLALEPTRIWYVGAALRDVTAAREAGFQTIWVNRDGAAYPSDGTTPDSVAGGLLEILPLLAEHYTRSLLGLRHVLRSALSWRPGHFLPGTEYENDHDNEA